MGNQYLSIASASKLMDMKRSVLQHKIRIGEIDSFEGKVTLHALKKYCPAINILEKSTILEKMQIIKDNAYANRIKTAHLPDADVLFNKLCKTQLEIKMERKKSMHYLSIIHESQSKLQLLEITLGGKQKIIVTKLLSLIAMGLYNN